MSKGISCEIIMDLMPSYLDGICSDASVKLVEEHLSECKGCRNLIEAMKQTEIAASKTDMAEVNYMKKVRGYFAKKSIAGLCLLATVTLAGFGMILWKSGNISEKIYWFSLPLLMLYSYFVLSGFSEKKENKRWKWKFNAAGMVFFCYSAGLILWLVNMVKTNNYPSWIPLNKWGPFLSWQFFGITAVQMILFLAAMVLCVKMEEGYFEAATISLTTVFLSLDSITMLHQMESADLLLQHMGSSCGVIFLEGILLGVLLLFLRFWMGKSRQSN